MLLFVFDGLLLLRFAERQLLPLLFQLPPRFTRFEPLRPLSFIRGKPRSPQSHRVRVGNVRDQAPRALHQLFLRNGALRERHLPPF